jgi:hypothetical protein
LSGPHEAESARRGRENKMSASAALAKTQHENNRWKLKKTQAKTDMTKLF